MAKGRKSSSKERFYITDRGREKGKKVFEKLSKKQQEELMAFRKFWDQKTTKAICKYIYAKPEYKKFLNKSLILNDLFPNRKLNRRRG